MTPGQTKEGRLSKPLLGQVSSQAGRLPSTTLTLHTIHHAAARSSLPSCRINTVSLFRHVPRLLLNNSTANRSDNPPANPKLTETRQPLLLHHEEHFTLPLADDVAPSELLETLAGLQEKERECNERKPSSDLNVDDHVRDAYIDMLLNGTIERKSRYARQYFLESQQAAWKAQLIDHYNAANPEFPYQLWCPVLRRYMPSNLMVAAYIVPNGLGEHNSLHLFGSLEDSGRRHLNDVSNGLLIHSHVKEAMDMACIAIVPGNISNEKADTDLIIVLLDKSIEKHSFDSAYTFGDLADRQLEWKHPTHRPRLSYLYYAFCITLLMRLCFDREGWQEDWSRLLHKCFWSKSDEVWIRYSSMAAIIKRSSTAKDMYAMLDSGRMPTGKLLERGLFSMSECDEVTPVAVQKASMEMRLRATGIINRESDGKTRKARMTMTTMRIEEGWSTSCPVGTSH